MKTSKKKERKQLDCTTIEALWQIAIIELVAIAGLNDVKLRLGINVDVRLKIQRKELQHWNCIFDAKLRGKVSTEMRFFIINVSFATSGKIKFYRKSNFSGSVNFAVYLEESNFCKEMEEKTNSKNPSRKTTAKKKRKKVNNQWKESTAKDSSSQRKNKRKIDHEKWCTDHCL